jgi:hypothetical protein
MNDIPTVRFTCANWEGGAYDGHHTGPCHGDGYVDVPGDLVLSGKWHDFVLNADGKGWSITVHHCLDSRDHDVNAGSRFHDNKHEMLFCCGPCMLSYLASIWRSDPYNQAEILINAIGVDTLQFAIDVHEAELFR